MPTTPVVFEKFGGLNFSADSTEMGAAGAIDAMNVDFSRDGRLRTRPGYASFRALSMVPTGGCQSMTAQRAVICGSSVKFITSSAVSGTLAQVGYDAARLGTTAAPLVYVATDAGLYETNAMATFTAVASGPTSPYRLGVTPWDNRLVSGRKDQPEVQFSNPGDGDTWGANNFIYLRPGDGEQINGICAWRDMLFVGKPSALFVFYGTDTDSSGQPIFRYRTIDAGIGPVSSAGFTYTMMAGRDAVYFIGHDGVYATTGGVPVKVSGALDPYFHGQTLFGTSIATGGTFSNPTIGVVEDRVYVCPNSGTSVTFVLNTSTGQWTAYDWAITLAMPLGLNDELRVPLIGVGQTVYKHTEASTDDAGAAISWRWASGYDPLGTPGQSKVSLESRAWGTGSVAMAVSNDFASYDAGSTLTLGTSPTVADAWQEIDREGSLWSTKLSGTGVASVSRYGHYLSFVKPPGVQ